ncbi:hypothetical protein WDJ50_18420 (plasmid) [Deinococcus sp. VB142]|uniref:Uncharacterized protein n=1 Tax=Deinococcus sp. VB142 TaxID=3112952 RepID=A0AAU6Q862_9DEIO
MTTISQELTLAERARRQELEATISRGWRTFIQVGEALEEIRAKRLYREDFGTFEEYCQKVWSWSRQRAYQMMDAAKTAGVLEEVGVTVTHEREARQLKPVAQAVAAAPVAQRKSVFEEAMQKAMTPAPAPVQKPSVPVVSWSGGVATLGDKSRTAAPTPPATAPKSLPTRREACTVTILLTMDPKTRLCSGRYSIGGEQKAVDDIYLGGLEDLIESRLDELGFKEES